MLGVAGVLVAACGDEPSRGLSDQHGRQIDPFALSVNSHRPIVWVFVTTDCPVANGLAPVLRDLGHDYASRTDVLLVHVDPDLTTAQVIEHAEAYGLGAMRIIVDRRHELVSHAGVTVTPEAVVYGSGGRLAYRGAIDDRYVDLGVRRPEVHRHYLRDALDAVIAGRSVDCSRTAPVGCPIVDLAGAAPSHQNR